MSNIEPRPVGYYCADCERSIAPDAPPNTKGMLNRVGCGGNPYKSHDWERVEP